MVLTRKILMQKQLRGDITVTRRSCGLWGGEGGIKKFIDDDEGPYSYDGYQQTLITNIDRVLEFFFFFLGSETIVFC